MKKTSKLVQFINIGTAKVQVAQPRQPCFKQGIRFGTQKIVKDFLNAPYSGIYLRIIEEGKVNYWR
jgi:MOSC domain-containing protein YiiM